jgi:ABC-2 type transport system permease protein
MRMLRIHLLETKYEFLKAWRMPQYALPTILFPMVFYVFFAVVFSTGHEGAAASAYLLANYGAFGVIGASLFGFGVTVAVERGQGWLEVKRTTPMPFSAYFVAKIVMALIFSTIIVAGLFTIGITLGHVRMTLGTSAELFAILISGSLPFCALGLAIGYLAGPNSAAAIVNLIYLPMAFLSGLWVPIFLLPKFIQHLAVGLPPFHFSQLALRGIGSPSRGTVPVHVLAMLGFTVLFLVIAYAGYRRDEGKLYG